MDLSAVFLTKFVMLKINVQDDLQVEFIDDELLDEATTRALGDAWLRSATSCVCRVKSALAPDAFNYLVNPLHPDIGKVSIEAVAPLAFDARLFG